MFAAVSRHDLIPAFFTRTDDCGDENAVFLDALHGFAHGVIVADLKWMVGEGMEFGQGKFDDGFLFGFVNGCSTSHIFTIPDFIG